MPEWFARLLSDLTDQQGTELQQWIDSCADSDVVVYEIEEALNQR